MGKKPKATFQMLMMDDDDNDLPSEEVCSNIETLDEMHQN